MVIAVGVTVFATGCTGHAAAPPAPEPTATSTSATSGQTIRFVEPGAGAAALAVPEISFAEVGDDSFAARFSAGAGPLEGLEIIQVGAQSGSVVLGMAFIGFHPSDAEAATQHAMDKLKDQLGATGSS